MTNRKPLVIEASGIPGQLLAGDALVDSGGNPFTTPPIMSAAIDTAFGSVQGDILYRDAAVWKVLAPGTAGKVLSTGGAGANPSWVTGGGGGGGATYTPPVLANFTYANTPPSATATSITGGIQMFSPSLGSTFNLNVLLQTPPATPYTMWTRVSLGTDVTASNYMFGVAMADGAGKLITLEAGGGASGVSLTYVTYTSYTSRNSFAGIQVTATTPALIGINDDGTNLNLRVSYDGVSYFTIYTVSRTAWFATGPTKIGLFTQGYSHSVIVNFAHWATSLPGPL